MRSSATWLMLLGVGVAAAMALEPACATAGHHEGLSGDDGGGSGGGGGSATGGSAGGGSGGGAGSTMDGGCVVAAPPALGVSLFSDTCNATAPPAVDWSNIRRISRIEYDNMVRDLVGDTTRPAEAGF